MITIAQLVTVAGTYAQVKPVPNDRAALFNAMQQVLNNHRYPEAFKPLDLHEYHCTLVYSEDTVPAREIQRTIKPGMLFEAEVTDVELFGPNNDTIVLVLESEDLQKRHNDWLGAGASHSWPEYRPHVTLSKIVDTDKVDFDQVKDSIMEALEGSEKITLTSEYSEPLIED